jgi:hypothetical protein
MKTKLLSLILLIVTFSLFGKPVDENRAKIVGLNFLHYKTNSNVLKNASELQLTYKVNSTNEQVAFYVFNVGTIGYVIVAGDDTVTPILGYSDQGNFISENIPSNVKKWLENYKKEIIFIIENDIKATVEINKEWNLQQANNKSNNTTLSVNVVSPLIQTRWDQSPYVNALCPFDNTYNQRTVTGCPATAMAQIMKYWNYPANGTGFNSYNHPTYNTLSANFANTTYQWSSMPNIVSSPNNAVATLMYHCGVAVEMLYGVAATGGSSSYVINSYSPSVDQTCENAFKTYFGYNASTLQGVQRVNYTDSNWINLLKNELNLSRPIQYAGIGGGGGHTWVCDGYDNNNFFHMNWGWGGNSDAYFLLDTLNPGTLGTGGGSGGFTSDQQALIGIQPPSSAISYNITLNNNVTPSLSTIGYGNAFSVSTNISNDGTNSFTGDYTIGIFDSNNNFIDYVETKTNYTLQGGYTYSNDLVFSNSGLFSMLPGTYKLYVYYRATGGNWKAVQNYGSYTNFAQITVVNPNSIQLNSVMTASPSTNFIQGQSASVNLNIANNGTSTFIGQYKVGLFNLDGTLVQNIATLNEGSGLPVGFTYNSPYLTFTTSSITANPGTYLVALQHKTTTGNWELTGSTSTFLNPITIGVIQAPYQADIYENNNTFSQTYNLPVTFSGNNANVNTVGSNSHIGTDNDYYKIILPSGYNYTITPRLQDSYNSNNGNTYSLDALFTYSTDGVNWSNTVDDVISGNILINNGGTLYFRTAPYFQGSIGTYLLDVNITRTASLGINENQFADSIKVYPNPAKDFVTINCNDFDGELNQINLINIQGQIIFTTNTSNQSKTINLPINNFSEGIYMLQLQTTKGILTKKLIITR